MSICTKAEATSWMLLLHSLLFVSASQAADDAIDLSCYKARELLNAYCGVQGCYRELLRRGDKEFPAYEAIFRDKEASPMQIAGAMSMVATVKGDRRRFHAYALRYLSHDAPEVRRGALYLLEKIGTEKDTPKLYPLMKDPGMRVRYTVPKTIAAIGGRRDLDKLNRMLQANTFEDGAHYRAKFETHRDAMKARLDTLDDAKGVVQPEP